MRCEADWQEPSGWPRLLSRSTFPEPCLPRTALTARVSRSTALRAGLLSLLLALLALAPDALVLADASPVAILAPAPLALVLAEGGPKGRPAAILAIAPPSLVLADGPPAAILAPAPDALVLADASPVAILARAPPALVLAER